MCLMRRGRDQSQGDLCLNAQRAAIAAEKTGEVRSIVLEEWAAAYGPRAAGSQYAAVSQNQRQTRDTFRGRSPDTRAKEGV